MRENKALTFWHEHIGKRLTTPPMERTDSFAAIIPHRTKSKGVQNMRIGALDAFYVASPHKSYVIGRVELPETQQIQFIPTESTSARKFVANWLLFEAEAPFMVGVIGKASALDSFKLTSHIVQSAFCQAGAGFTFDLDLVRKAHQKIAHLPWKKVASGIHNFEALRHAEPENLDAERKRMNKFLSKNPELRSILPQLRILPNSGEYTVLSWLNIGS